MSAYGSITSPSGPVVWQLITDLNSTQEDIGLRFGNKFTSDHIAFHGKKMKVSLAVQTLLIKICCCRPGMSAGNGITPVLICQPYCGIHKSIFVCSYEICIKSVNDQSP